MKIAEKKSPAAEKTSPDKKAKPVVKAKAAETKVSTVKAKVVAEKAPVAEKEIPDEKAKPAAKVKATEKEAGDASEGKVAQKKEKTTKTKKSDTEK